jgi:hypothetical protein
VPNAFAAAARRGPTCAPPDRAVPLLGWYAVLVGLDTVLGHELWSPAVFAVVAWWLEAPKLISEGPWSCRVTRRDWPRVSSHQTVHSFVEAERGRRHLIPGGQDQMRADRSHYARREDERAPWAVRGRPSGGPGILLVRPRATELDAAYGRPVARERHRPLAKMPTTRTAVTRRDPVERGSRQRRC